METEAGAGSEAEQVPPQAPRMSVWLASQDHQEGAVCRTPALGQVLVPAPPGCPEGRHHGGGGVSTGVHQVDRSRSISTSISTLAIEALCSLPDGLMTFPASWLLSNASSLCFSSLFSILMLEILSNLAFKFPKRKCQLGQSTVIQFKTPLRQSCFARVTFQRSPPRL